MNHEERERIRKNYVAIVEDLSVKDVLPLLRQEGIIDDDDEERILAETTRKDKVRFLLSKLPLRGPRAYSVFRTALMEDYEWIVAKLDATQVGADEVDASHSNSSARRTTQPVKELTHKIMRAVAHNPDVLREWKMLARCLDLDETDIIEVEYASPGNVKEASYQALLKWRCRKGSKSNLETLLSALYDFGLNNLADQVRRM